MMKKKTIIVITCFFVILILFLWFLFNQKPKETEKPFAEITPTPIPIEETGEGDPNAFQKLEEETIKGYPLFPKTPHREDNWTLDYVDALHLEVTVKGTITAAIKTQVLDWIKDQGVDPSTHQIDWKSAR